MNFNPKWKVKVLAHMREKKVKVLAHLWGRSSDLTACWQKVKFRVDFLKLK